MTGAGWFSWSRSVTSCSWPTTALRRSPPPHWASHWRNITVVASRRPSSGSESRGGRWPLRAPAAPASRGPGSAAGTGTSQRCMGSMRAGPAERAREVPRKPRRASIRSLRENSPSSSTVCGPAQGRSTPETEGVWWAVRSPSCSMATTEPNRSENSSDRIRGTGSRGCSPSSQRRTREVSVLMWWAPICRARRFTWRASSPFDQPLRTNQDVSCSLRAAEPGASGSSLVPLAPLPLTGTPPSTRPLHTKPWLGRRAPPRTFTDPPHVASGITTDGPPSGFGALKVILRSPLRRGRFQKRHHSPPLRMN